MRFFAVGNRIFGAGSGSYFFSAVLAIARLFFKNIGNFFPAMGHKNPAAYFLDLGGGLLRYAFSMGGYFKKIPEKKCHFLEKNSRRAIAAWCSKKLRTDGAAGFLGVVEKNSVHHCMLVPSSVVQDCRQQVLFGLFRVKAPLLFLLFLVPSAGVAMGEK